VLRKPLLVVDAKGTNGQLKTIKGHFTIPPNSIETQIIKRFLDGKEHLEQSEKKVKVVEIRMFYLGKGDFSVQSLVIKPVAQ